MTNIIEELDLLGMDNIEAFIEHQQYFNEDMYYDILSAFCKSVRGSDTEAALYCYAGICICIIRKKISD